MMKRICLVLLVGALLFGVFLVGCSNKKATHSSATEDSETEPQLDSVAFQDLEAIDDIQSISIINSSDEIICVLEDQVEFSDFVTAFELLRFARNNKNDSSTSENTDSKEYVEKLYHLKVQHSDGTQFMLYIEHNGFVYYIDQSDNFYFSMGTTSFVLWNLILTYEESVDQK